MMMSSLWLEMTARCGRYVAERLTSVARLPASDEAMEVASLLGRCWAEVESVRATKKGDQVEECEEKQKDTHANDTTWN